MDNPVLDIGSLPAGQQPGWDDTEGVRRVRRQLLAAPGLVGPEDVRALRSALAVVAAGEAHVVQAGDCAEDPAECTAPHVARKTGLLDVLAGTLKGVTHRPVVRVGRMAGQFGKPRSKPTEWVGDLELPVYRGHMVNGPEPDPLSRRPDPRRLLACYHASGTVLRHLGRHRGPGEPGIDPPVWTSHEALVLDYEVPLVREDPAGAPVLTSTHWPWIGDRTRQLDGAHVALLAAVANPVACKVGPGMTARELLALCERLDPAREPGRLTLIARMGAQLVAHRLPPLVAAVREAGHPVIWLSDPMHANTVTAPDGRKTRYLDWIVREVRDFRAAVRTARGTAGGLHLETTPDDVTECAPSPLAADQLGGRYTSLCDPRLRPDQAVSVVAAWGARTGESEDGARRGRPIRTRTKEDRT
ncbi:3-deoxy-7-phosphoheptulonate synthase [Streptomyces sp. JV176]|uniref:3-deoxy-7-phosphoheptulonate synthase n=1 Tax=Streptomyces sp. JV176 TaxID=858630 RepID=UPI002E79143A|nr:3-deoxy-7-phosphoheptulonate synthase [Streptomyces sp. JV176]MEE1798003.1 3-deoxy-7-phosphoheptulonate synthase [Streptomyces sp. JV176]